jgi:hypothetical protein
VDVFLTIALLLVLFVSADAAVRPGPDSPNWELRWRGLDADDRVRISTAARSAKGASLTDPEETELAAGFRRRDRRRRAYVDFAVLPFLLAAIVFADVGLLSTGVVGLALALYGVFNGLWSSLRVREMSGKLRAATSPDAGL